MSVDTKKTQITILSTGTRKDIIAGGHLSTPNFDPSSSLAQLAEFFRYSYCIFCVELAKLRSENAYWRKMHQKAVEREAKLKQEVVELKAKLCLRERQLFGRKSEKGYNKLDSAKPETGTDKKPRGQQPGSKGHGRRDYTHLPAREEICDIPESERRCPICGLPFASFPGTENSELIEIEVSAYRRIIKRKRYKPTCKCGALPGIVAAPAPPKLISKGIFGISVWVNILLDKFLFMRPTYRLLSDLKTHGLDIAQGTLTDGLKAIAPLFAPVCDAITARNLEEKRWHADETRWFVFVTVEGKVGYKWYMWVFRSPSTVLYKLDRSRSAQVPKAHFNNVKEGILVVDRYAAYKAMAKHTNILLAFCWAHVRRDFLGVARDWPHQETWAIEWVNDIGKLYYLNNLRLSAPNQSELFDKRAHELRIALDRMAQKGDVELSEKNIHPIRKKVLESLKRHFRGLTVFVDHPEIPMDNNEAERLERIPVIGRKNFYGSGALWSGQLTAVLFSIFQTLALWNINPRLWLTAYLEYRVSNQGKSFEDIQPFLPWNMPDEQRKALSIEPEVKDSS